MGPSGLNWRVYVTGCAILICATHPLRHSDIHQLVSLASLEVLGRDNQMGPSGLDLIMMLSLGITPPASSRERQDVLRLTLGQASLKSSLRTE